MKFDRRDFMRMGAAGVVGALGPLNPRADWLPRRADTFLKMRFKGLCLLEGQPNAMVVHMVDNLTLDLPEHLMEMRVPESAINQGATRAKPDGTQRIGSTTFLRWRLNHRRITGPPPSSAPDLTIQAAVPADLVKPNPDDDEGWKSLHWVPDLRSICGATRILKPGSGMITLNHGEFRSMRADGSGPHVVWKFTSGSTEITGLRRRLTNQVLYVCPSATALTILVDSDPIVFNAGTSETIEVVNQPVCHVGGTRPLNMDHFTKFYDLVDAQGKPTPGVHEFSPPNRGQVEPDYCPPGRI